MILNKTNMAKKFISQFPAAEIDARLAAVSEKVGYTFFNSSDGNTLYSFASEDTYNQWVEEGMNGNSALIIDKTPFSFEGTMRRLTVVNLLTTQNPYFTTNKKSAILRFGYASQYKGITEPDWQDFDENAKVTVEVDKGFTGEFVKVVDGQQLLNGKNFEIDVYQHIAIGDNKVRVTIVGETTATKGTLTYTVALTSMFMLPSASGVNWHQVLVEGEQFSFGGFNIGGTVNKTVKVRVYYNNNNGEIAHADYEENIGTKIYTSTAYTFKFNFHQPNTYPVDSTGEPITKVCRVEIWTEAGSASTDKLTYYLMFASANNKNTAKLACINDIREVKNGATEELFKFAIYDGTLGKSSAGVRIGFENQEIYDQTLTVDTQTKHSITTEVNVESESGRFELTAMVYVVDGSAMFADIPVDNSANYPAESDYTFYFNAANKSNGEADKDIVNERNGVRIPSTYTNISWVDGIDGYTTDEEGIKGLRIPAKCGAEFNLFPLSTIGNNGLTIEMMYRASYPSDSEEPIISIASKRDKESFKSNNFSGLLVTPNTIVLNTTKTNKRNQQSYNLQNNELVHLMITIVPKYKSYNGNIVQVYVNAGKKISFEYNDASDFILNDAKLILGSQTADLMFYKMRIYPQGFTWDSMFKNYVNAYPIYASKASMYSKVMDIVDENFDIDYEKVVSSGLNYMVIEMLTEDGKIPSKVNGVTEGYSNLLIKIKNAIAGEYDSDFEKFFNIGSAEDYWIENELNEGQGTTAMGYARWNFRWKMGKNHNKRRITAKKNVASSMQSHKMGATRIFNDVFFYLYNNNGSLAENTIKPSNGDNDIPTHRVAIYQYPVFGFQKSKDEEGNDVYEFIGLYTVGPDKGDKDTFGYGDDETLIRLEGADHDVAGVGFEYPWASMEFKNEFLGGYDTTGTRAESWEVGAAFGLDVAEDDEGYNKEAVQQVLDAEFKDAYEVAYNNDPYVIGLTESEWAEMMENPASWREKIVADGEYQGRPYSNFKFYKQGEYVLHYFNVQYSDFRSTGLNVVTDLNLTVTGKTEAEIQTMVREGRRARFRANVGNYWNVWDSIYHYAFVQFLGATDNFMKNTYPYKFKKLKDGGRWRWVQDDLDTILDVNNKGAAVKGYSIMVGDRNADGAIYVGDSSVFWTLIRECFVDEVREMGRKILGALYALSGSNSSGIDGVLKYFRDRWFAYAQDYFGIAGYNEDTEWTYEDIWGMEKAGNSYQDTPPLLQALGSHYEAEFQWIYQRIIFFSSMVGYGDYAGNDTYAGSLSYRAQGGHTFHITPAMDMSLAVGVFGATPQNNFTRVKAGQTAELSYSGLSDTQMALKGFDFMSDIGDLSTLRTGASSSELTFSSKMLNKINIGNEDAAKVTTNVSKLNITNCPSLESIYAKNAQSIAGVLDLTNSPRITSVDVSGTNITEVMLPNGSKIETLRLPESTSTISFVRLPKLNPSEGFSIDGYANLQKLRLEENVNFDGFAMLKEAYQQGDNLQYLRIIGFDYSGTAEDVTMLKTIATEVAQSGNNKYHGIDADGNVTSGIPVIQGKLTLSTPVYKSELEEVENLYNAESLQIESEQYYIEFEDPEVKRVVLASGIGDGYGVTEGEASAVTTELKEAFLNNTVVRKFNELSLFNNASVNLERTFEGCTALEEATLDTTKSYIDGKMFKGCTALKKVTWGDNKTEVRTEAFRDCISLEEIGDISNFTGFSAHVFRGCKNLKIDVYLTATKLGDGNHTFSNSGITSFSAPNLESWTLDIVSSCGYCENLESVYIPKLTKIGEAQFRNNPNLKSLTLSQDLTSIGVNAFRESFHQDSNIELDLPNLITLGQSAFNKSNIRKFSAQALTNPSSYCFVNCALLTHVSMPSLQSLPSEFFSGCSKLESVEIPKVLAISASCFNGCESLKMLTVNSVRSISNSVFFKSGITNIKMDNIETIGDRTFDGTPLEGDYEWSKLRTIGIYCFRNTKINSVKTDNLQDIGEYAFYNSKIRFLTQDTDVPVSIQTNAFTDSSIEEVRVKNLVSISGSFYRCTKLKYIDVANLESITAAGFYQTSLLAMDFIAPKLRSMSVNSTFSYSAITSFIAPYLEGQIGKYSLQYCNSLTEIVVGNVTSLGDYCFGACPILTRVVIYLEEVPDVITGVFTGSTCPIYLPDDLVETVKTLTGWSDYASRIKSFTEGGIPTDKEVLLEQYTQQ